jgi:kynurenine/2-aminoadipate aminotransferase
MNYDRFFSETARHRHESWIKKFADPTNNLPYALDGGYPNSNTFPFQSANITLKDGSNLEISGELMDEALMYTHIKGYPPLINHVKDLQKRLHNPPRWNDENEDMKTDVIITVGSADGLSKALDILVNPGDCVLVQEPGYATLFAALSAFRPHLLPMKEDEHGINPQAVREVLSRWKPEDWRNAESGVPKVMYLVPNSSNPSGAMLSLERRKELYQIAREYNMIILEDDAYYFLQFSGEYIPSFLSLDVDGRVLRFDTFSKTLSAGMRVGFITAPRQIVRKLEIITLSFSLPSVWSMVAISELFRKWGFEGFMKHVELARAFYKRQCELVTAAAEKWLTGLAEWNKPKGGMFLWVKILGVKDSTKLAVDKCRKKGVSVISGTGFMIGEKDSPYVRIAYSIPTEEKIDTAFRLFAEAIKEELEDQKKTVLSNNNDINANLVIKRSA